MRPIKFSTPFWQIALLICTLCTAVKGVLILKYFAGLGMRTSVTSSTLSWETYTDDIKQLQFAVIGGSYHLESGLRMPAYVCRAKIEGIFSSGTTKKEDDRTVCVSSFVTVVRDHHAFEILINKNHYSRLVWSDWNKYTGLPLGSVSIDDTNSGDLYIARYKIQSNEEHHNHIGLDYIVGRLDPSIQLGKILVNQDGVETDYEDGEVLIEIEPSRYELRNVQLDDLQSRVTRTPTPLGQRVLANDKTEAANVDTVISYMYDKQQSWGTIEGMAKGLEMKIYDSNGEFHAISWGLKENIKSVETKVVALKLQAGTASNISLEGSYTVTEGAYTADLTIFYNESSRQPAYRGKLSGYLEKKEMLDVKINNGPIYWIHNQTFIPTTTTTTTTTTEPTTTSVKSPKPIEQPIPDDIGDNEIPADAPQEKEEVRVTSFGSSLMSEKKQENKSPADTGTGKSLIAPIVTVTVACFLSSFVV